MEMIKLDRIVGQAISGEIYIVDHVFKDGDRLGVVGSVYRPVLAEEHEDATSPNGLARHLERWWNDARRRGDQRSIGEYAAELYAEKGAGIIWDVGDPAQTPRLREFTGLDVDECPMFTCCGGGMCFNRKIGWCKVVDALMLYHLLDLEHGHIDAWEYFVKRA